MFEASGDLGGQWHTAAAHSGVWPGMHTNTSRAMTAFSDFPAPAEHPLHPAAEQIHAYLRPTRALRRRRADPASARRVGRGPRRAGRSTASAFDAVVVASGRFRRPRLPPGSTRFGGELLHAFDYPGAEPFRDRRTLVYGNGISGLEIASDLAPHAPVDLRLPQAALRDPEGRRRRLVGLAVVHGASARSSGACSRPRSWAAG